MSVRKTTILTLLKIIPLLVLPLLLCHCASPYWRHRGNDLADVMTLSVGSGYAFGVKGRVGSMNAGLYGGAEKGRAGLRGGQWLWERYPRLDRALEVNYDNQLLLWGTEAFTPWFGTAANARGKAYYAQSPWRYTPLIQTPLRGEQLAKQRFPETLRYPCAYWTDVQATVGFSYFNLRVGLNPLEIVDFLFGWTTLDMFGDDVDLLAEADLIILPEPEEFAKKP